MASAALSRSGGGPEDCARFFLVAGLDLAEVMLPATRRS